MPRYVDDPPAADQRVTEMHVWIATQSDGGEGIASADVYLGPEIGERHMPLMASNRKTAERLAPIAERTRQEALVQAGRKITMRLVTFRRVED